MVTTVTPYFSPHNRTSVGQGYDGVVRITVAGNYGTGVLLYDGFAVLTVAHLFSQASEIANIRFETTAGIQTLEMSSVTIHPNYDSVNGNNDLALVWLASSAPKQAIRHELYRDNNEIGQSFTMVGYGAVGSGTSGTIPTSNGDPLRLKSDNQFDIDPTTLKTSLGNGMAWTPTAGTQLAADFDDGTHAHDAFGQLINTSGLGLGFSEGLIAPGDSGGPAFIGNKIAGIANYTASLSKETIDPDIDNESNSSFGEIAAWQRVSTYQQWVDQSLRAKYPNAPIKPEDVQKEIVEGNSGTSLAYFLVSLVGTRSDPDAFVSVDYASRDGTATAGQDYLAVSGTLKLYPNEDYAAIPVEIIGDTTPEGNETFYLDVTNPVGGSFGEGIVKLTAVRTILADDGWIA